MEKKIYPPNFPVYALSEAFVSNVYRYGRNFEFGLALKYFLKANPGKLMGNAGFGLKMIKRGRIAVTPHTIKKVKEVRAIIDRANKLEG